MTNEELEKAIEKFAEAEYRLPMQRANAVKALRSYCGDGVAYAVVCRRALEHGGKVACKGFRFRGKWRVYWYVGDVDASLTVVKFARFIGVEDGDCADELLVEFANAWEEFAKSMRRKGWGGGIAKSLDTLPRRPFVEEWWERWERRGLIVGGLSSEFARLRRAAADLLARKDFE